MIVESVRSLGAEVGPRAARHMDAVFRGLLRASGSVETDAYMRLVTGESHPMGNIAIVSRTTDRTTTFEAVGPLFACGAPATAIFPAGLDDGVAAALRERGFTSVGAMPAMAVDIDQMAATSLPPGYSFQRIGAADDGRDWAEALAVGYEIPRRLADMFAPGAIGADMSADARIQFFAVLRDGRQVATSMLCLEDGLAGIYCVSTRPEERNRGLGAHATAEALRVAGRLGYRVGVLQSSPAGYPVYIRLGFGDFHGIPFLVHLPE